MPYTVEIQHRAEKFLRGVTDQRLYRRLRVSIDSLGENPRPAGCVKLTGSDDLFRLRVAITASSIRFKTACFWSWLWTSVTGGTSIGKPPPHNMTGWRLGLPLPTPMRTNGIAADDGTGLRTGILQPVVFGVIPDPIPSKSFAFKSPHGPVVNSETDRPFAAANLFEMQ